MGSKKFASSYCYSVSGCCQFLYNLKKTFFSNGRFQNFSSNSIYFDKIPNNAQSMAVEKLKIPPLVSKKHNQLSKVEEKDIEIVESLKKGNIYHPYKGPGDRMKKVLSEDFKITFRKIFKALTGIKLGNLEHKYFLKHTDILIVGGGAVGLSIAFAIKNKFPFGPEIIIIDKDDTFPHISTNLGQGIVTFQFLTDEEELDLLKYGVEFFSTFPKKLEVDGKPPFQLPYEPLGSLVLVDNTNVEQMLKKIDMFSRNGIPKKILDPEILKNKFPWLNVEGLLFASLGMCNEGIIDPWAFLMGLKCKCINLGVHFVTGEVIDFGTENGTLKRAICKLPDGTYNSIDFAYCVLANGLESLNLVKVLNEKNEFLLKLRLPLEERMRYEYCFYNPTGPGLNTPNVIDSDGTYFRRDGLTNHYVAGVSSVINDSRENEPYEVFNNKIKPFLMKRIPSFNEIDLVDGWIDAYDFCISNQVGITGPHPEAYNLYFALGFSHLGLQYLPALGRAVMEHMLCDNYTHINFEMYHIEHLWRKQHLEADRQRRELLESQKYVALPNEQT